MGCLSGFISGLRECLLHSCSDTHFRVCLSGLGTCLLFSTSALLSGLNRGRQLCLMALPPAAKAHQLPPYHIPSPCTLLQTPYFCPTQKPLGFPIVIHVPLLHPGCSPNRSCSLFFHSHSAPSWEHPCLPTLKSLCPC